MVLAMCNVHTAAHAGEAVWPQAVTSPAAEVSYSQCNADSARAPYGGATSIGATSAARWRCRRVVRWRRYKVQLVSAICGSILYSAAFEFGCTICCTANPEAVLAQWKSVCLASVRSGFESPAVPIFFLSSRCRFTCSLWVQVDCM